MTPRDALALLASFGYVIGVLVGGFLLRRTRLAPAALRAVVHVAVGVWIVPTALLFDTRWAAMAVPLVFVMANAIGRPRGVYRMLQIGGQHETAVPGLRPKTRYAVRRFARWGLVLFPAAVVLVIGLWWSRAGRAPVVAGVLCLGLGDPSGSLVGRAFGRRPWRRLLFGRPVQGGKTLEGTAAVCLVCGVVAFTALVALVGIRPAPALVAGLVVGLAGAVTEALTPGKLDNLSLPLVCALCTDILARLIVGFETAGAYVP